MEAYTQQPARRSLLENICAWHGLPSPFLVSLHFPRHLGDEDKWDEDKWESESVRFKTLILAESKHIVAEALHRRILSKSQSGLDLQVEFESIMDDYDGVSRPRALFDEASIKASRTFSARNRLDLMRPGTVVELRPVGSTKVEDILLGTFEPAVWTTIPNPKMLKDKRAIRLYGASKIPNAGLYKMHPLTSLLSYARQFEATQNLRPDLYPDLMSSSTQSVVVGTATHASSDGAASEITEEQRNEGADPLLHVFDIPPMNEFQRKASTEFLTSSPGSFTLVQGPPGTGKTTMLTATICNFLLTRSRAGDKHPRLMVCAPSNKAVSVLAARYLEATTDSCKYQAAMVGDKDKILSEDHAGRLEDIFVYTWLPTTLKELQTIATSYAAVATKRLSINAIADRLYAVVPQHAMHPDRGVPGLIQCILKHVGGGMEHNVLSSIKRLRRKLEELERGIQQRKVDKANVIFCTLSSAASSIIMRTQTVESLIIDEAAAACEPETYIPIASKRPTSIMIVGDPKQLPATIMSQLAKSRGLAKSLQERLMYDEKHPYTMLKIQYRMRPEISCFPSTVFYNGGIANAASVMASSDEAAMYRNLVHDQPYCFVQVDGTEERRPSGSFHNEKEAEQVVAVVEGARRCIRRASLARSNQYHFKNMRVITFYQAQVDLISRLLRAAGLGDVTVSTVDSCQGSEANLVIISFVRTGKQTIGFLSDQRRLNVALTRAKHKLVCIGNIENGLDKVATKGAETVRKLAEDVTSRQLLVRTHAPKEKRPPPTQAGGGAKRRKL